MLEENDRKLMLKIADRLKFIEIELETIKKAQRPAIVAPTSPLNASQAANKFFGVQSPTKLECTGSVVFKGEEITDEIKKEVDNGSKLLRKAVMEFCEEFEIKEFNIKYIDPTPEKDI